MKKRKNEALFVKKAAETNSTSAIKAESVVFCPLWIIYVSLPNKSIEGPKQFCRNSGAFSLEIESDISIPFGPYLRRILIYFTNQVIKYKKRVINLGKSVSSFSKAIGISSNGTNGERLKNQLIALLSSIITTGYSDNNTSMMVTEDETVLTKLLNGDWCREIKLSEAFFDKSSKAIPIDDRVISFFGDNSLMIDLYSWLTHKYYRMQTKKIETIELSREQLKEQFGLDHRRIDQCFNYIVTALNDLKVFYPQANFQCEKKSLTLIKSPPHVPATTKPIVNKQVDK